VASERPATLPESGADVAGMTDQQVFAPLSVLFVVGDSDEKVFVTDESGVFVAQ